MILLIWLAWRSINYYSGFEPGPDSSIFLSMGWHVAMGQVLYIDVWDHKPPLIFLLNAVALAIGDDGINSVRIMERVFSVLGVTAVVTLVYIGFGKLWLGFLSGLLYLIHFYDMFVIEHGNVTEEYGAVLTLLGMAAVITVVKFPKRRGLALSGLAGAAFSMAVLCKEPFLLIVPPWFLYILWEHGGNKLLARLRAILFVLGGMIPGMIFLGYLLWYGAWGEWVDIVAYNLSYGKAATSIQFESYIVQLFTMAQIKVFNTLLLTQIAAVFGLVHALWWLLVKRTFGLPVVIALSALLGLFATSLSGRYYGHYFLFLVPSYVLLCASGIVLVANLKSNGLRLVTGMVLLALTMWNISEIEAFAQRLAEPSKRWSGHQLSRIIRNNTAPNDLIWSPWKPLLYAESRRLSPTKWHFIYDHLFIDTSGSTEREKYQRLKADLERHQPRVIVLNAPRGLFLTRATADAFLSRSDLKSWIAENYWTVMGSSGGRYQMLVAKAPADHLTDNWAAPMRLGLKALYEEGEPIKAIFRFYQVLSIRDSHYGARFQLAKALDVANQRVEARRVWQDVYAMATPIWDRKSSETARTRLLQVDTETQGGWMMTGLSCLYTLKDFPCAINLFRKVVAASKSNLDANLELAKSLDLAGDVDAATVQWRIVLGLAEAKDASESRLEALVRLKID